jgi:hypothetical protein
MTGPATSLPLRNPLIRDIPASPALIHRLSAWDGLPLCVRE